ncbi:hypothetical protein Tco_0010463 [Tanacetum coccineum]
MSTHEQITNNLTSAVRNTGGRNGPQGLEEPMSDESPELKAVKNRTTLNPRHQLPEQNLEEGTGGKKCRSPSPRLRPQKEGSVFNRLGRKEPATSARPDSRQRSPQAKRVEVEAKRRQQRGTPSLTTSNSSEVKISEGGHWKSKVKKA